MAYELLVLRVVHVLCGVFWVGYAMFMSWFLMPVLAGSGATAGAVMAGLQRRRVMTIVPVAAVLTILSGVRLMQIASGGFSGAWFATPAGHTLAGAGVVAIVAFAIGMAVARPAGMRAARLGAQLATAPEGEREVLGRELGRLRRRNEVTMAVVTALLVLATVGMAVARYL